MASLAIHHPLVDCNKRMAFAAADVFLRINGWRLHRPPMQIHAEMVQMLDAGTFYLSHLDPWLRDFASPQDDGPSGAGCTVDLCLQAPSPGHRTA